MTSLIHGTAIAIGDFGILIRGAPGSGKSSLALRMIDAPGFGAGATSLQAVLVADDQVLLEQSGSFLFASPPCALAGLIEMRGVGILSVPFQSKVMLNLVVDLKTWISISRLPEAHELSVVVDGLNIARVALDALDPAAPARLRACVTRLATPQGRGQ
jgi:HPr kinase/phosphorylase